MINMSYCRFENTVSALNEILEAIEDGEYLLNSKGELCTSDGYLVSRQEQRAFQDMAALCSYMTGAIERFEEEEACYD